MTDISHQSDTARGSAVSRYLHSMHNRDAYQTTTTRPTPVASQ
jgi:hypothetical protein